jgi:hypothetical protein
VRLRLASERKTSFMGPTIRWPIHLRTENAHSAYSRSAFPSSPGSLAMFTARDSHNGQIAALIRPGLAFAPQINKIFETYAQGKWPENEGSSSRSVGKT